jgi:hypothetical protein
MARVLPDINQQDSQQGRAWWTNTLAKMGAQTGDWKEFLRGLGGIEGEHKYGATNGSYIGIYQFRHFDNNPNTDDIFQNLHFIENIGKMLR